MRDYIKYHPIKFLIWVVLGAALLSGLIILILLLTAPKKDYVAIVGNKKITKTQYQIAKEQCEAGYTFAQDEKTVNECDDIAIENLVYYESLEQEARQLNVDVSSEVEKSYQNLLSNYGSEKEALEFYRSNFSLGKEDIKRNLEIRALEKSLKNNLLKEVNVINSFVRYDVFISKEGEQKSKENALAIAEKYFREPMESGASEKELQALANKIRKNIPKYNNPTQTNLGIAVINGLNNSNVSKWFYDNNTKDWEEIKKLKNVGDTTSPFISPDGGVNIWRLERRTKGTYNSWEDYKKAVVTKAKVSFFGYNFRYNLKKILARIVPSVFADCSVHMAGFVVDKAYYSGTNVAVKAGTIKASFDARTSGYTTGCSTAKGNGTATPGTNGFVLGDNNSFFSCMVRWDVWLESTNSTFYKLAYYNVGFQKNGGNQNIDWTKGIAAYGQYWNSSGVHTVADGSENGNNDGVIDLVPRNVSPTVVHISPSGSNPTYQLGGTSGDINIAAKATDNNPQDTVKYLVAIQKSDDNGTTWTGFQNSTAGSWRYFPGSNNHVTATYSGLQPNNKTYTVATFDDKNNYSALALNTNTDTKIVNTDKSIFSYLIAQEALAAISKSGTPVGKYRWKVAAQDNHNASSGWSANPTYWYFTIKADTNVYQIYPEDLKSVRVEGGKTTYPMPFEIKVVSTKKVQAKIWIDKQNSSGQWALFKDVSYGSLQQATMAGLLIDWPAIELTPGKYRWFTKVKTDDGKEIQRAANVADAWEFTVVDPPKSCHIINYTADPKSGNQPLTVKFSGSVKDAVTQKIDYGDGTTGTSPTTHTYPTHTAPPNDKVYNATFSCTGEWSGGNESITIPITVKNPACKIATFYADPSSGGAPLTVNFPNTTIDETSTKIDYGDGTSGTKPTPHTYSAQGTYTVTYTCYGPAGNDTKQAVVTVKGWKGPSLKMSWCPGYSGTSTSLRTCLGTLSTPTFGAFGGVSVFFILLNAIQLIMARGVPIKMAKAKRGLLYSFIALGIITLSYLIVIMIYNLLA